MGTIREAEERSFKLLNLSQGQLNESQLTDVASRIEENEDLVDEIFYVGRSGQVTFPSFKPLYNLNGESAYSKKGPVRIEENNLFKSAEAAEYKTRNYSLAITNY